MKPEDREFIEKNIEKAGHHKVLRSLSALADLIDDDISWGDETDARILETYQDLWNTLHSESPGLLEKFILYKNIPQ